MLGGLSLLISIRNDWISQRVTLLLIFTFLYVSYSSFFLSTSSVTRYPLSNSTIHYYHRSLITYPSNLNNLYLRPSAFRANIQGPKEGDEDVETYCARIAAKLCGDLDIPAMGPGAIDLTIEASGAPTCIQIGVHVLKPSYVNLSSSSSRFSEHYSTSYHVINELSLYHFHLATLGRSSS